MLHISFRQIPCRCILKTYREWISIHNINVPFKDNKRLNKRWDTHTHPFYEQVLNGNLIPREHISLESNDKEHR